MNANDLMSDDPMTVDEQVTLDEALAILQTLEVRHLPVVREDGAIVGMLSDRDIRNSRRPFTLPEAVEDQRPGETAVTEVMSSDVVSVSPEADTDEIIDIMLEHKVGALPVVDPATGELLGIVSYIDVLRGLRSR